MGFPSDIVSVVRGFLHGTDATMFALVARNHLPPPEKRQNLGIKIRDSIVSMEMIEYVWRDRMDDYRISILVAKHGEFSVLKALYEKGAPLSESVYYLAAERNNVESLRWFKEIGRLPEKLDSFVWYDTAYEGCMESLQWLLDNIVEFSPDDASDIYHGAAMGGQLHVAEWIESLGYPLPKDICSYAVEGGHLDILKWAVGLGARFPLSVCIDAINYGHIPTLEWMLSLQRDPDARRRMIDYMRNHTEHASILTIDWINSVYAEEDEDSDED